MTGSHMRARSLHGRRGDFRGRAVPEAGRTRNASPCGSYAISDERPGWTGCKPNPVDDKTLACNNKDRVDRVDRVSRFKRRKENRASICPRLSRLSYKTWHEKPVYPVQPVFCSSAHGFTNDRVRLEPGSNPVVVPVSVGIARRALARRSRLQ